MSTSAPILKLILLFGLLTVVSCRSRSRDRSPPPLPTPTPAPAIQLPQRGSSISDFERLANWSVDSDTGSAALLRNQQNFIWGRGSAELRFTPESAGPHRVTLTPFEPWRIQSQFDTILLWILHEGEPWIRADHFIQLQYRDRNGLTGEWRLPYQPKEGWQMLHVRVKDEIPYPVSVESLRWILPERITEPATIWLDSLSIYQEVLGRIPKRVDYVRPHGYAPTFAPLRSNSVTLDFPTRPEAYRPQTRSEPSVETLERLDGEHFLFQYESEDSTIGYQISPASRFPRVQILVDGELYQDLWQHAGVLGPVRAPELRFSRVSGNQLELQYTEGVQFLLSLHGKTLQIEINSLLENIQSLDLGTLSTPGGGSPRMLWIPFMRLQPDQRWPVFLQTGSFKPLLISLFPDWWFSLGGSYSPQSDTAYPSGVALGEMRYENRWRGNRNMFRERLYLTVSHRLQDVLPSPASPRALFSDQPIRVDSSAELNLLSIHPLEAEWEDGMLARTSGGHWREHPQAGYVVKSGRLDGASTDRLLKVREEVESSTLRAPAVGEHPPWRFTDYDVRMVGAGSYTQTLAEIGAFLQQAAAEWGGALVTGGGSEWLWSGLVTAFVPEFPHGLLELHPFLPQFAWRNVHPFSRILGLGDLEDFRLPTDTQPVQEETRLDRYLAVQLAYAATGKVPHLNNPVLQQKAQQFNQVLHAQLSGKETDRIAYWDGERFVDVAEALQSGHLESSRLYIRLDDQTECWINGDLLEDWHIRVDGRDLRLPPFGFVIRSDDLFAMNIPASEHADGWGVIEQPDSLWLYSPDQERTEFGVRLQGALRIHQTGEDAVVLDIADWQGEVGLQASRFPFEQVGSIRAVDGQGNRHLDLHLRRVDGEWVLRSELQLKQVRIYSDLTGADLKFSP
jgi:hypothetical protein